MSKRSPTHFSPVIKWTGSKRSQAPQIVEQFPPEFETYYEPFVGGGAILYQSAPPSAVCGDILNPLIEFWRILQEDPAHLVDYYERQWQRLQREGHEVYYEIRDRYNENPNPYDLLFLSRTCVNGLIRFNAKGEFNNSFHHTRPGIHPKRFKPIAVEWSDRLSHVDFRCGDYRDTSEEATQRDFVYLDPPYFNTHGRYFGQIDYDDFLEYLEKLNSTGVRFALSYDGRRAEVDYTVEIPSHLYKRRYLLESGLSPFRKVMDRKAETVKESLYLNW